MQFRRHSPHIHQELQPTHRKQQKLHNKKSNTDENNTILLSVTCANFITVSLGLTEISSTHGVKLYNDHFRNNILVYKQQYSYSWTDTAIRIVDNSMLYCSVAVA